MPVGQTDCERAFCWLLAELAAELSRHGRCNFLLCDGEALYAHATDRRHWPQRRHPFGRVRLVDRDLEIDLAQANGPGDRMVPVATEPLTHGEPWTAFQPGEPRVFAGGRACWQSAAMAPATA